MMMIRERLVIRVVDDCEVQTRLIKFVPCYAYHRTFACISSRFVGGSACADLEVGAASPFSASAVDRGRHYIVRDVGPGIKIDGESPCYLPSKSSFPHCLSLFFPLPSPSLFLTQT